MRISFLTAPRSARVTPVISPSVRAEAGGGGQSSPVGVRDPRIGSCIASADPLIRELEELQEKYWAGKGSHSRRIRPVKLLTI